MSFLPGLFWAGDEVSLRQGWLALGLPLPGYACVSVYYVFVFASYCARVCVSDVCMYKVWVRVLRVVFVSKWIYTTMCICSNVWVMYLFKDCVFMRMLFSAYLPSFFFTEYNRNRPCFGYNKYHQQHNYYMSSIFFSLIFFLFLFSFFIITSFGIFSSRVSPRDRKCSDFPVLYFFFIVSLFPCYQKLPFFLPNYYCSALWTN